MAMFLTGCLSSVFTTAMLGWTWVMFETVFPEDQPEINYGLHPYLTEIMDRRS